MANVDIKYCTFCASNKINHEFQDKTYGRFNRVFNINEETGACRCTVCGNKKDKK